MIIALTFSIWVCRFILSKINCFFLLCSMKLNNAATYQLITIVLPNLPYVFQEIFEKLLIWPGSPTIHWHTIHWHNDSLTPRFTDNTKSVEIHIWSPAPNTKNLGSEGYGINKIWGFCSNMDLSDHAYIMHTGVSEGEVFNEKTLICRKLTVLKIIAFKSSEFP